MSLPPHRTLFRRPTYDGGPSPAGSPSVIYCRVSSPKQMTEGDGLKGQETNCRSYAEQKGYSVLKVFTDGISGGANDRQGLDAMLLFIKEVSRKSNREVIVIVDDLKRFARDVIIHFDLKLAIFQHGGRLESPLFRFDDTPEGRFIETIVAAQAELERNQNRRQVRSRMQARLEQGYWTFKAPPGLRYHHDRVHKKVLVLDNPRAEHVAAMLDRYAQGLFGSHMDIWRFLAARGFYGPAPQRALLSRQLCQIRDMLRQLLYTGHLEFPAWGISLRKAQHPALISFATFQKIQERLQGTEKKVPRGNVSGEFPLRGLVLCMACGRPLTGGITRKANGLTYPYYHCAYRGCSMYGTTIKPSVIEPQFKQVLAGLEATDEVIEVVRLRVMERCKKHEVKAATRLTEAQAELTTVSGDLRDVAARLGRTKSDTAAQTLEARIEELARREAVLQDELSTPRHELTAADAGTLFKRVRPLLQNPLQVWETSPLVYKKVVTRIAFTTPLRYDRKTGFGTPDIAVPYRITRSITSSNSKMVDPEQCAWEHLIQELRQWATAVDGA